MNGPFAIFKWEALFKDFNIFLEGFLTTLEVSILGLILALMLGIIFGVLSTSKIKIFKVINRIYVEVIQNTPLVIQVFFLFNGLPYIKVVLPVFLIGILGVGVYHGAYISEVVRTGITSIPKGQFEAAKSQGFSHTQTMRYIILPQTVKIIIPPLANQLVNLIKNTSVLAMIAGGDLMYTADSWSSANMYYGPAYVITGALYFIMCYPLAMISRKLELREKKKALVDIEDSITEQSVATEGGL
ncbi:MULTISPECIES: amino acid ABC transporter permease [Clostridium]|mgnify:CR=1 FL=1|jgi:amino acid ABC transporter membrane protein 1, PAAT family (TC 3.A.1.3.-)|uniref:Amino acid ABC transporter permease n=5 Tax=Clostridium TaxID=1485 RepID=A0A1B9BHK8_CLOBE|nr:MULTISPECIES: amino acid ABC transporter permease [Clostridium]ABR36281.1 polar amino acid ABC transporter, inner membrane subunit [Clostridium beijerinckii NCIMB 8052]AIU04519.1 polar amino acid ABC transporter, inner membrane subunit [Clostridium beijerinckii ATCC 35702]ALB44677.1 amino acid ABC transporter permease [Clostridium beijerinckii NRRL B-598]AVK48157.1 glutamine ABC transporter permease [Clostridium sp. MF28]MBC2457518.1 amino acid ABC transporter permease [Clostridium beijerin